MKTVLRSIKPYWVYLICEGEKTIEIGKQEPKDKMWNKKVLVYCSKDKKSFAKIPKEKQDQYEKYLGHIVASFDCNNIKEFSFASWNLGTKQEILKKSHLTEEILQQYLIKPDGFVAHGFAWFIDNLCIFKKFKDLNQYGLSRPPQSYCYIERKEYES